MEKVTISASAHKKKRRYRRSPVIKHSITLAGNKTSVSLEDKFWDSLREIAQNENVSLQELIERINKDRIGCNLSSSARLFVLNYFKAQSQSPRRVT